MKQLVSIVLIIACLLSCLFFSSTFATKALSNDKILISENHATYEDGNNYSGDQIVSHFNVGKFADFNVVEKGGTHIDGEGNIVFSNYLIFGINLNFDASTKMIGNTGVKVSRDNCDWNDTPYASAGDTEQYVAYGAISATRTNAEGDVFKYEPIFSKGNTSIENMFFNEDGDYTVFVLFETLKNGRCQNHVLSWSFKIRSYIYLVDKKTGFPIKESGISSKDVLIDCVGRKNIDIECELNGSSIDVYDGFVLSANGQVQDQYKFIVKSNGFVCEIFNFRIDSKNPTSKFFFANIRRQIGEYYYEAEKYFYLTWTESAINPIAVTYQFYDYNVNYNDKDVSLPNEINYTTETILSEPGLYCIKAKTLTEEKIEYWVEVVKGDAPSYNYEALSTERFNNFKTKWYEVYDDINNRYLCFDVEEYNRAYEAAMTIENSSVSSSTGKYYYNGEWYSDRIDLTAAMNNYVFAKNLNLVYFDPTDYSLSKESERTFSAAAFDGVRYLNDSFQFVSSHYSETYTVTATDNAGNSYELQFFIPISQQNLPNGEYVITETDMYGNTITYSAYRDKTAPVVSIILNGTKTTVDNGGNYVSDASFQISDFFDEFDNYAVIKIKKPDESISYYYQNEYVGIVFQQTGDYIITAYDRNDNIIKFSVRVN